MTSKEAYNYLLGLLESGGDMRWSLVKESMDKFKELVDKATPKKPIIKQYKNSEHYLCPNCKNYRFGIIDYGEYKNEWRKGSELMLYCPKCGQALDWSDEDDK